MGGGILPPPTLASDVCGGIIPPQNRAATLSGIRYFPPLSVVCPLWEVRLEKMREALSVGCLEVTRSLVGLKPPRGMVWNQRAGFVSGWLWITNDLFCLSLPSDSCHQIAPSFFFRHIPWVIFNQIPQKSLNYIRC